MAVVVFLNYKFPVILVTVLNYVVYVIAITSRR